MPDWILWLGGVLLFLVLLSASVAVHEAGHMVAAKKLGLKVPEYSIGFGPKIFKWKRKETDYSIRAIPLGGFVMIQDLRYPEKTYERNSLSRVKPWKRQIIFAAGPLVNIVIGVTLLMVTLLSFPYQRGTTIVEQTPVCSTAVTACGSSEAGIRAGDKILTIDGEKVETLDDIASAKAGKDSITVTLDRAGQTLTIPNVTLEPKTSLMGIIVTTEDAWRTPAEAWTFVEDSVKQNLIAIAHLPEKVGPILESIVVGDRPDDTPSSVVSIGKTYGDVAVDKENTDLVKFQTYLLYTALFNIGLGVLNLTPIIPLDGGRMLIAFMDSVRIRWAKLTRKKYTPIRETVYFAMASVSTIAVFGFMGALILSDFSLIFHGNL